MATIKQRMGRILGWTATVLFGLALVVGIVAFLFVRSLVEPDASAFGAQEDEAKRAKLDRTHFRAAPEPDLLCGDGQGIADAAGAGLCLSRRDHAGCEDRGSRAGCGAAKCDPRAEYVDRLDRRKRPFLGFRRAQYGRIVRSSQDDFLPSKPSLRALESLSLSRAHQRALLQEGCWPRRKAPSASGSTSGTRIARPTRSAATTRRTPAIRASRSGRAVKLFRSALTTASRRASSGCDYSPIQISTRRLRSAGTRCASTLRESYYNDKNLVRPYRVGMSCAFCHVGPNPITPPKDPENPRWSELTSNPGAQYYWVDRIFFWDTKPRDKPGEAAPNEGNFLYQVFHTNPPGSLDTSLVSSDYMNNPRTMNAVYEVLARLQEASRTGSEELRGGERDNKQFQDYPQTAALAEFYDQGSGKVNTMRVLKDGADSVGTLGALNRVYLNIGLFSEEWLLHFRPFIGGQKISPIRIADAQKNSVYWNATEDMTPDMATFFLATARADRLEQAPGGRELLAARSAAEVDRGKEVFAETCAACHSSKQPQPSPAFGVDTGICEGGGAGPQYRECWDRYWAWAQSDEFKRGMKALVTHRSPDGRETFLQGNYLSTERRVPLDVIGTNACSAIATNGLSGDIWDNFTSSTYKSLPPAREVTVNHPVSGAPMSLRPLGNGRGYIRPASLVSLWSTAPFLLNNSVGYNDSSGDDYYYNRADHEAGYGGYGASCPAARMESLLALRRESARGLRTIDCRNALAGATPQGPADDRASAGISLPHDGAVLSERCRPATPRDIVRTFARPLSWVAGWAVKPDGR